MVREPNAETPATEEAVRLQDEMDPEGLERLRNELKRSRKQAESGDLIPIEEILDEL